MKSLLLIFCIFFLQQGDSNLVAQVYTSGATVEDRVQIQMDELKERLKLSDEQQLLLKEILLQFVQNAQDKRQELEGVPKDSLRTVLAVLENNKNSEVKTILTQSQFEDYIKYVEEQRLKRRERFRR